MTYRRTPLSDITLSLPLPSLKHLPQFELARDPSTGSMQNGIKAAAFGMAVTGFWTIKE